MASVIFTGQLIPMPDDMRFTRDGMEIHGPNWATLQYRIVPSAPCVGLLVRLGAWLTDPEQDSLEDCECAG